MIPSIRRSGGTSAGVGLPPPFGALHVPACDQTLWFSAVRPFPSGRADAVPAGACPPNSSWWTSSKAPTNPLISRRRSISFGQVPAIDDNGTVLADSNAILVVPRQSKYGNGHWLPSDPVGQAPCAALVVGGCRATACRARDCTVGHGIWRRRGRGGRHQSRPCLVGTGGAATEPNPLPRLASSRALQISRSTPTWPMRRKVMFRWSTTLRCAPGWPVLRPCQVLWACRVRR